MADMNRINCVQSVAPVASGEGVTATIDIANSYASKYGTLAIVVLLFLILLAELAEKRRG